MSLYPGWRWWRNGVFVIAVLLLVASWLSSNDAVLLNKLAPASIGIFAVATLVRFRKAIAIQRLLRGQRQVAPPTEPVTIEHARWLRHQLGDGRAGKNIGVFSGGQMLEVFEWFGDDGVRHPVVDITALNHKMGRWQASSKPDQSGFRLKVSPDSASLAIRHLEGVRFVADPGRWHMRGSRLRILTSHEAWSAGSGKQDLLGQIVRLVNDFEDHAMGISGDVDIDDDDDDELAEEQPATDASASYLAPPDAAAPQWGTPQDPPQAPTTATPSMQRWQAPTEQPSPPDQAPPPGVDAAPSFEIPQSPAWSTPLAGLDHEPATDYSEIRYADEAHEPGADGHGTGAPL